MPCQRARGLALCAAMLLLLVVAVPQVQAQAGAWNPLEAMGGSVLGPRRVDVSGLRVVAQQVNTALQALGDDSDGVAAAEVLQRALNDTSSTARAASWETAHQLVAATNMAFTWLTAFQGRLPDDNRDLVDRIGPVLTATTADVVAALDRVSSASGTPDLQGVSLIGAGPELGVYERGGQDVQSVTLAVDNLPPHNHLNGPFGRMLPGTSQDHTHTPMGHDTSPGEVDFVPFEFDNRSRFRGWCYQVYWFVERFVKQYLCWTRRFRSRTVGVCLK